MTALDLTKVGMPVACEGFVVTKEAVQAYAEATNDTHPAFLDGAVAPPVFATVPIIRFMAAAKRAVSPAFTFHGEHDLVLNRQLEPGMHVTGEAQVIGVRSRSTGVAIYVRGMTRLAGGEVLNEQYMTSFLPGATCERDVGHEPPPIAARAPSLDREPDATAVYAMDDDQTARFADASGDRDRYTVDESYAKSMGFETRVVHGLCTMAFTSRAVIEHLCGGDPARLERLAVRFSRPLYLAAGQRVVTRIWKDPTDLGCAYEALDADERPVITNGIAAARRV